MCHYITNCNNGHNPYVGKPSTCNPLRIKIIEFPEWVTRGARGHPSTFNGHGDRPDA